MSKTLEQRPWRIRVMAAATAIALAACTTVAMPGASVAQNGSGEVVVDFNDAMRGLNFASASLDGNLDATMAGNGMVDADEMALIGAILADPKLDLRSKGGVDHGAVAAAYAQADASAKADLQKLASRYPTAGKLGAGYVMLGETSLKSCSAMAANFGAPMKGDYSQAVALGRFLADDGDVDGDSVSNRAEYLAFIGEGRAAFIKAALRPDVQPAPDQQVQTPPVAPGRKVVGVVLYPGYEVLDVFGPVEMWAYVPDCQVVMISQTGGAVRSAQGVSTLSDYSFANAPQLDIMMMPGGGGTFTELNNKVFLDFIKKQDQAKQLTTSVCTGSALLAKAGLLKGRKATSNKNFCSLAVQQDPSVDWQGKARWVEDGKYIASSGVSAGTAIALGLVARLYGAERAGLLADSLEYEWNSDPTNDPFAIPYTAPARP